MSHPEDLKDLEWVVEHEPEEDTNTLIRSRLRAFNEARIGPYHADRIAVLAYDGRRDFVGGIVGRMQWGWLSIEWAWVERRGRRRGLGTAMLAHLEALARERAIFLSRLNTASFQEGLEFYRRNGYEIFAELDILAPNGDPHKDFFLRKTLPR